jgi:hypothetical protein
VGDIKLRKDNGRLRRKKIRIAGMRRSEMQLMYEGAYLDIIVQEATGRLTGID